MLCDLDVSGCNVVGPGDRSAIVAEVEYDRLVQPYGLHVWQLLYVVAPFYVSLLRSTVYSKYSCACGRSCSLGDSYQITKCAAL